MRGGSDCSTGPELREVSRSEEAGEEVEQEEGKKKKQEKGRAVKKEEGGGPGKARRRSPMEAKVYDASLDRVTDATTEAPLFSLLHPFPGSTAAIFLPLFPPHARVHLRTSSTSCVHTARRGLLYSW